MSTLRKWGIGRKYENHADYLLLIATKAVALILAIEAGSHIPCGTGTEILNFEYTLHSRKKRATVKSVPHKNGR